MCKTEHIACRQLHYNKALTGDAVDNTLETLKTKFMIPIVLFYQIAD